MALAEPVWLSRQVRWPPSHCKPAASSRASPAGLGAEQEGLGALDASPYLGLGVLYLFCVVCASLGAVHLCGVCHDVSLFACSRILGCDT